MFIDLGWNSTNSSKLHLKNTIVRMSLMFLFNKNRAVRTLGSGRASIFGLQLCSDSAVPHAACRKETKLRRQVRQLPAKTRVSPEMILKIKGLCCPEKTNNVLQEQLKSIIQFRTNKQPVKLHNKHKKIDWINSFLYKVFKILVYIFENEIKMSFSLLKLVTIRFVVKHCISNSFKKLFLWLVNKSIKLRWEIEI